MNYYPFVTIKALAENFEIVKSMGFTSTQFARNALPVLLCEDL